MELKNKIENRILDSKSILEEHELMDGEKGLLISEIEFLKDLLNMRIVVRSCGYCKTELEKSEIDSGYCYTCRCAI